MMLKVFYIESCVAECHAGPSGGTGSRAPGSGLVLGGFTGTCSGAEPGSNGQTELDHGFLPVTSTFRRNLSRSRTMCPSRRYQRWNSLGAEQP